MKRFQQELKLRFVSFIIWLVVQVIGRTARFRIVGFEHVRKSVGSEQGFIMAVWHGRSLLPIFYCRGMGIWAITSLSRDGEFQTRIVSRFGYRIIRGSTGRGGIKAALTACKKLEDGGILAITPDGPKGPPNKVQEGIVFMAQRTGSPIIPIGVGARPRKLLPAWDSYLIPALFSKCAIVFGEPISVAAGGAGGRPPTEILECALNDVQHQAQSMVKEGC